MNTMTLPELTQEYILTHDLRPDTVKIYWAATKSYVRFFGTVWQARRRTGTCSTGADRTGESFQAELEYVLQSPANGIPVCNGTRSRRTQGESSERNARDSNKRPKENRQHRRHCTARNWLNILVQEERATGNRTEITPAWFWLTVFEMFYYTG
ncbi:Phage integrase, partial [Pseudomonas syringae pv. pisi str. 1704B]